MEYQAKSKELICTMLTTIDADGVAALNALQMFGDATRVDTPYFWSADGLRAKCSVYRPDEMVPGVRVRVRILLRSYRGTHHRKIVLVPLDEAHWQAEDNVIPWQQVAEYLRKNYGLSLGEETPLGADEAEPEYTIAEE